MSFRLRIAYVLVHRLGYTNKEAKACIASGSLTAGGKQVTENIFYNQAEVLALDGMIIMPARVSRYIAFYKPAGIETTYNEKLADGLHTVLSPELRLPYAGRLDKASEGLLLLSDDGSFVESITSPDAQKEKEYIVKTGKPLTGNFILEMRGGVTIQGYTTKPCEVMQTGDTEFTIILTEGRNRQIRRMCYKLGYEVLFLKRVRIDAFLLGDLKPGEWKEFSIDRSLTA
jgi:23S rRNA pseudouridine2604 synthase